ncbi:hypothetical protein MIDIC_240028 [Alphaproteobacteria bacterium]
MVILVDMVEVYPAKDGLSIMKNKDRNMTGQLEHVAFKLAKHFSIGYKSGE